MKLDLTDTRKVAGFLFHPDIFDAMADDHAVNHMTTVGPYFKTNAAKTLLGNGCFHFLQPAEHVLFMFTMRTHTLFDVHTMILPEGRGKQAVRAARDAAAWMFDNTTCEKLETCIPVFNKAARIFARVAGMQYEGTSRRSFKKDHELHDQWVFGLTKEEFLCLP